MFTRLILILFYACFLRYWKPSEAPFEMCWFYMGIAQIALDPPLSNG